MELAHAHAHAHALAAFRAPAGLSLMRGRSVPARPGASLEHEDVRVLQLHPEREVFRDSLPSERPSSRP